MEINLRLSMTASQRFLHHFSLHCSDYEGTIKYAHVCPALQKKSSLLSLVKLGELERKRESRRVDFGSYSLW